MIRLILLSTRSWLSTVTRLREAVGICFRIEFLLKRLFLCRLFVLVEDSRMAMTVICGGRFWLVTGFVGTNSCLLQWLTWFVCIKEELEYWNSILS